METIDTPSSVSAPSSSASPSPSSSAPSAEAAAKQYIEALASNNATEVAQMVTLAEPGTVAHSYGLHRIALTDADRAAGGSALSEAVVTDRGEDIEVCEAEAESCLIFSDFKAVASGKLASFTINGEPIDDRLLPPGERAPVTAGGVKMTLLSAYRSVSSDALTVTVDIVNGSSGEVTISTYEAVYVASDGRQSVTSFQIGPTDLQAGASAPVAIAFDAVDVGGTLTLEVFKSSDFSALGTFKIPVK